MRAGGLLGLLLLAGAAGPGCRSVAAETGEPGAAPPTDDAGSPLPTRGGSLPGDNPDAPVDSADAVAVTRTDVGPADLAPLPDDRADDVVAGGAPDLSADRILLADLATDTRDLAPPSCRDGILNADETDVDCGPGCLPCDPGERCRAGSDCSTMFCRAGQCARAASCQQIKKATPAAGDGVYALDPKGEGASVDAICDMTADGGGWTLVANAWIPSYAPGAKYSALGQFVMPHDPGIAYQAARLQCQSTSTTVNRIRTFVGAPTTDLDAMSGTAVETYDAADNVAKPSGTGDFHGYAEWHDFAGFYLRYIVRVSQVHCALSYEGAGGQDDNPALGRWGRIWVR